MCIFLDLQYFLQCILNGFSIHIPLFVIVMKALPREFGVGYPRELLFADDFVIIAKTLEELNRSEVMENWTRRQKTKNERGKDKSDMFQPDGPKTKMECVKCPINNPVCIEGLQWIIANTNKQRHLFHTEVMCSQPVNEGNYCIEIQHGHWQRRTCPRLSVVTMQQSVVSLVKVRITTCHWWPERTTLHKPHHRIFKWNCLR